MKSLCKKYEYEMDESRAPLFDILGQTFDMLGGLVNQVINVESDFALEVLYLVCKIFYTSNQLYLCPFMTENHCLDPWIQFFKSVMDRPAPPELESFIEEMHAIEQRDKHIFWKIKGIAARITYRLFSKYGNPKIVEGSLTHFTKQFLETYAVPLLESHLQLVFKRKTLFVGSMALNNAIKYVSAATKQTVTMNMLLPYVENLLFETIIPIMLITHRDVTLFKDDPIEYIRKQQDFTETLFAPKNAVVDLLLYLCSYKSSKKNKKPDYLNKFLEFCLSNLNQYQQQPEPDWRIKEAILFSIGSLVDQIRPQRDLNLEAMMSTHVMPELQNTQPFLRMRAIWLYGEFGSYKFKDDNHVKQVTDMIYRCLFDPELPVRVTAGTSIHLLLQNTQASNFIKPALKNILEVYLKMMTEIDSEDLINALEEIVSLYKDDIEPYALQLSEQLVLSYQRLIQVPIHEDDGESQLAAVGCVTALRRIIDSVSKNQQLLAKIEPIIYPILMHSLTPDGLDAIEDGLDCLALILYHGHSVSADMWNLFPQLLYVGCGENDPDGGFGFEYVSQIALAI